MECVDAVHVNLLNLRFCFFVFLFFWEYYLILLIAFQRNEDVSSLIFAKRKYVVININLAGNAIFVMKKNEKHKNKKKRETKRLKLFHSEQIASEK